jgi:hypothetical protein
MSDAKLSVIDLEAIGIGPARVAEVRSAWLTVNDMIRALGDVRRDHGGDCPVLMADGAPVKRLTPRKPFRDDGITGNEPTVVYVNDL